jgi:hypothetical protein
VLKKFPSGDWLFNNPSVNVDNVDVSKDIRAVCYGDVNGSYVPSKRIMYSPVSNSGTINISKGRPFDIPVYLNENTELGAIGIKLKIKNESLKILNVTSDLPGLIYNITDEGINIAWTTDNVGMNIVPDKPLFYIKAICNGDEINSDFQLSAESVLADSWAYYISIDKLYMPQINLIQHSEFNIQNYPNPFTNSTNIVYNLPEDANVSLSIYNVLGEKVASLVNAYQKAGDYTFTFNGSDLKQGVYYCKIEAVSENASYTKTNIMTIVR